LKVSNGGGNGNGYRRNGNGGNGNTATRTKASAPPVASTLSTQPYQALGPAPPALRIILEETDDEDGDHERLRALVNAIGDYAGDAEVRLSIRQRDGEEVEMALPPVRYCPELTQTLGDIIGPWGTVGA